MLLEIERSRWWLRPTTAVNPFRNFWVDVLLMLFYFYFFSLLKHFRSTSSIKKFTNLTTGYKFLGMLLWFEVVGPFNALHLHIFFFFLIFFCSVSFFCLVKKLWVSLAILGLRLVAKTRSFPLEFCLQCQHHPLQLLLLSCTLK